MIEEENKALRKRVFRDEVSEYLVTEIIEYRLKPGDRIVETKVSKALQVSQGAVREAIRDLIAKGMLISRPYQGTYVRSISLKDVLDYYSIREILECTAISWIQNGNGGAKETAFSSIVENMISVMGKDQGALIRLNCGFHAELVKSPGNELLVKSWDALGNLFWMAVGKVSLYSQEQLQQDLELHTKLAEQLEQGDKKGATETLREHFSMASSVAREHIQ